MSLAAEQVLITLQAARGVRSHYKDIDTATITLAVAFVPRPPADAVLARVVRSGLGLLLLGVRRLCTDVGLRSALGGDRRRRAGAAPGGPVVAPTGRTLAGLPLLWSSSGLVATFTAAAAAVGVGSALGPHPGGGPVRPSRTTAPVTRSRGRGRPPLVAFYAVSVVAGLVVTRHDNLRRPRR